MLTHAETISKYVPVLYVFNKIDSVPLELVDKLSREPMSLAISCELSLKSVPPSLSLMYPSS